MENYFKDDMSELDLMWDNHSYESPAPVINVNLFQTIFNSPIKSDEVNENTLNSIPINLQQTLLNDEVLEKEHEKVYEKVSDRKWKCLRCSNMFVNKQNVKKHQESINGGTSACDRVIEKLNYKKRKREEREEKENKRHFICFKCNSRFLTNEILKIHLKKKICVKK